MRGLRSILLLCVLLFLGLILFAKKMWPDLWNENYLYLTQTRENATISLNELSDSWTEKTVHEHFQGFPINCTNAQEVRFDRACTVDVKSVDGVAALTMTFFFKESRLSQAFIRVPGWSHLHALDYLRRHYGPHAMRNFNPEEEGYLLLWGLRDGSAVIFNEESYSNPLQWNTILWISATQCYQMGGCIR